MCDTRVRTKLIKSWASSSATTAHIKRGIVPSRIGHEIDLVIFKSHQFTHLAYPSEEKRGCELHFLSDYSKSGRESCVLCINGPLNRRLHKKLPFGPPDPGRGSNCHITVALLAQAQVSSDRARASSRGKGVLP